MTELLLLFLVVFSLNLVPAFSPPTWMVMSLLGLHDPTATAWQVALVAACGATGGRVVLAYFAKQIVRQQWLGKASRDSLTTVADLMQRRRATSMGLFLLFAFSPLPSNFLFLSYGLTGAPLALLAVPFFVGRCMSYVAWFSAAAVVSHHFEQEFSGAGRYLGTYFVLTQLALLALVYVFTRIDWRNTLRERRLRWLV